MVKDQEDLVAVLGRRIVCIMIGELAIAAMPLSAGTISNLYDTGVGSNGVSLSDATSPDPHYTIVSGSDGSLASTTTVKTSASGYPVESGYWNGDSTTSAWILPSAGYPGTGDTSSFHMPAGDYDYLTTFTLPTNANSITVSANISADNELTEILLNGESVGSFATGGSLTNLEGGTASAYDQFNPISFASDNVLAGTNSLVFQVNNDAGPTGLRVDGITGTFTVVVPEPGSLSLGGLAIGCLALLRRCRVPRTIC